MRIVAGAHRCSASDLIWLRTFSDMSREFGDPKAKAKWLAASLEVVTDLDPGFGRPYEVGHAYLLTLARAAGGGADAAVRLLEKAARNNPTEAGPLVYLAMVHHMERRDRAATLDCLRRAKDLNGFDSASAAMLSKMLADERDDVTAIRYWLESMTVGTAEMKRRAELGLFGTKGEIVRRAVRDYTARNGKPPSRARDLADPSLIEAPVIDVVLDGLATNADGTLVLPPRYERASELRYVEIELGVERWCRVYRDERGRWPTLDDIQSCDEPLPKPPDGKRWRVEDGNVELVDE